MADAAKRSAGRPSTYTDAIAEEICRRIADGEPLRQICRDDHMPKWQTIYHWKSERQEFSNRIAHARELGTNAIAEDTLAIIDTPPERVEGRIDPGFVSWQKNRVEQRMKLLAKWNPKAYGDKLQTELSGSVTVNHETALAELA